MSYNRSQEQSEALKEISVSYLKKLVNCSNFDLPDLAVELFNVAVPIFSFLTPS
jgi:hypothetical protein